jgi:hypothetical protein
MRVIRPKPAFPLILLTLILCQGCGGGGVDRVDVSGAVTWKGQPVPMGLVFFTPGTAKGNRGPQGFALIKDGRFDTRFEKSKGTVTGPHTVMINACSGQDINRMKPYGSDMFVEQPTLQIEIPEKGGEINLVIPDSVVPAPAVTSESY